MTTIESTAQAAFLAECAAQGVALKKRMVDVLTNENNRDDGGIGYRRGVLAGVVEAAISLKDFPGYELADKALDPTGFADDVPSRVLAGLVNVSLGVKQEATPHFSVEKQVEKLDDCCAKYEDKWSRTLEAMQQKGAKKSKNNALPLVQIFTDEDGEPKLMRKGRGRPTALLLVDAAIGSDEVVYPAGSAVQISTPQDVYYGDDEVRSRKLKIDKSGLEIVPVTAIEEMSFLRMTPYQVPLDQRARHFTYKKLSGRTMPCTEPHPMVDEIRDIARSVIQADELPQSKVSSIITNLKRLTDAAFRVCTGDNRYDILA